MLILSPLIFYLHLAFCFREHKLMPMKATQHQKGRVHSWTNYQEDLNVKFKLLLAMPSILLALQNSDITICFQIVWSPHLMLNELIWEQYPFPSLPGFVTPEQLSHCHVFLTCWSSDCMMVLAAFWALYKKTFSGGGMLMDLAGAPSSSCSLWSLKWIITAQRRSVSKA